MWYTTPLWAAFCVCSVPPCTVHALLVQASKISNNLVRMMVSTTLASITRLSQLVYNQKKDAVVRAKDR